MIFSVCFCFLLCEFIISQVLALGTPTAQAADAFKKKCYDDLGCFSNGPPFYDPVFRPYSLMPFELNSVDTKFYLYTRQNPDDPEVLNYKSPDLTDSKFHPGLDTKIFVHGYLAEPKRGDIYYTIKDALLKSGDYNVIMVDWSDSNGSPYPQAAANSRLVGAQLARLVHHLQIQKGLCPPSVHIIGHSMGAHLAGFAGERIANLGKITGLDPAGPLFYQAGPGVRLDPSDAKFVDIIHSNGGNSPASGIGIDEAIGHVDFYPNGGQRQPTCLAAQTIPMFDLSLSNRHNESEEMLQHVCDHAMAVAYYLTTISKPGCRMVGRICSDWVSYKNGMCRRAPQLEMGPYTVCMPPETQGVKVFLQTEPTPPFCQPPPRRQYSLGAPYRPKFEPVFHKRKNYWPF